MEQNSISNTPSLELHVIMEHSPSVTNYYRLISMRKFHPSNARRRMPRMNNDHVSLYSEETNVGLVVHLYWIVPHIHSALFPALYMGKKTQLKYCFIKQESSFSNAWKTCTRRRGDFRNKPTSLFSLVKHHIYNKVCPCFCFCKGNCSWRQQSPSSEVNYETKSEKKGNLVSAKVNNRDILLLFRQKWLSL